MSERDHGRVRLASRSDPSPLQRRVSSALVRALTGPELRAARRGARELLRRARGAPHRVEYFHRVDDAYGVLAAQVLAPLAAAYDVELVCHLAGAAPPGNEPEPELLSAWAQRDAADVAPSYGLAFPRPERAPDADAVRLGERILAAAPPEAFASRAVAVGTALFAGDRTALSALASAHPPADEATARAAIERGSARRSALGHYSGAMFHYAGEWYWGVDRLCHLELRLASLGALRAGARPVAPRPAVDPGPGRDDGSLVLDFFPSLRSPYTAVAYDATLALAQRAGVRLVLRPVMPMVMRGVALTFTKGLYIFADARREAELAGVRFGSWHDPIGSPVERAFALWPWAREQGREAQFLGAFLRAAFAEGVDTSAEHGLRYVVESAGLPWTQRKQAPEAEWRSELEDNRVTMYRELGLWGVPSYRVRGPEGAPDWSTWGQDRLWRVAAELRSRIAGGA